MELHLYDTAMQCKQPFAPLDPARIRLYACGPTVYDHIHLGNARTFVVFDLLFRLLRYLYGSERVIYVRNITDIDDKIIAAAQNNGESPETLTTRMTVAFHQALGNLGVLRPTQEPRATTHIPDMIAMIGTLIDGGYAYEAAGHVLFDTGRDPAYGSLSRRDLAALRAGARVEIAPYKRNSTDFVLWKPSDAVQPGWDSPWGRGRPGWHIECSAMAVRHLGKYFDIHGGGIDLIFPHHENECAQSRCAYGLDAQPARYWIHVGFLHFDDSKMSKSLGNTLTMKALSRRFPGAALRLGLLTTHYRQPLRWRETIPSEAHAMLMRWQRACGDAAKDGEVPKTVLAALCDDLNIPEALAAMHRLATAAREADTAAQRGLAAAMNLLGLHDAHRGIDDTDIDISWIEARITMRNEARQRREFAVADKIRKDLEMAGILLEDNSTGTRWYHSGALSESKPDA